MKIERYTIGQLREILAQGVNFEETFLLPKARVLAQINNPRAAIDDVVLLLGYEGKKVIGSLGIVPDCLFLDGERKQLGWLNNWNGASDQGHSGMGALLFLTAMSIYENRIAVSGFTEAARRVYEGSRKFVTLKEKNGATIYLRVNSAAILVKRFTWLRFVSLLLNGADKLLNHLINLRLKQWQAKHCRKQDYSALQVPAIDDEITGFINEARGKELFRRGANELNWMKEYPWEIGHPKENVFIKILDHSKKLVGFVFLKVAGGSVTVPYYFCQDKHFDLVLKTIGQHLIECRASELLVYEPGIVQGLRRLKFPTIHQRARQKTFLISKSYKDINFGEYQVHDGDGDAFI